MKTYTAPALATKVSVNQDFSMALLTAMRKSKETQRPFFLIVVQIQNFETFKKRRPPLAVKGLMRELFEGVRKLVHPSQFVGVFHDGLALVFDRVDPGQADNIARRLKAIAVNIITTGRYNDLVSRWTDIIYQFLAPNKPSDLRPIIGWAVYPRDGSEAFNLVQRALNHAREMSS